MKVEFQRIWSTNNCQGDNAVHARRRMHELEKYMCIIKNTMKVVQAPCPSSSKYYLSHMFINTSRPANQNSLGNI